MAPKSGPWWRCTISAPATSSSCGRRRAARPSCCHSPMRLCPASTLRAAASSSSRPRRRRSRAKRGCRKAMAIRFFSQSETHCEFSNFAPFGVDLDGKRWPTTEHYYQAQKFADPELQTKIRKAEKPIIAKNLADKHRDQMRADWDAVKDEVMYRAVRRKFELHPELRDLLLATGTEEIVETVPNDYYWGVGREGTGQNKLGKIIERSRAELRAVVVPAGR